MVAAGVNVCNDVPVSLCINKKHNLVIQYKPKESKLKKDSTLTFIAASEDSTRLNSDVERDLEN